MSKKQDDVAEKAIRKSTLINLKVKKASRLKQLKSKYENDVRQIHIEYAEDPERLKAKFAAAEYAKTEKGKKRAEKRILREQKEIDLYKSMRNATTGEEIFSSIVQGIGAALFVAALAILDTLAVIDLKEYKVLTITMYSLFGSSMILMYLTSLLSHAITNIVAKDVFRRLSHDFSYLVLGFTYTVFSLTKIQGIYGWALFGTVWLLSLLGIIFYSIFSARINKFNIALYIITGSSILILGKMLFHSISPKSFSLLISAGFFYFLGIILYGLQKIKYLHAISNIMFLTANILLFFSMFYLNI